VSPPAVSAYSASPDWIDCNAFSPSRIASNSTVVCSLSFKLGWRPDLRPATWRPQPVLEKSSSHLSVGERIWLCVMLALMSRSTRILLGGALYRASDTAAALPSAWTGNLSWSGHGQSRRGDQSHSRRLSVSRADSWLVTQRLRRNAAKGSAASRSPVRKSCGDSHMPSPGAQILLAGVSACSSDVEDRVNHIMAATNGWAPEV
jgi:hypothetical protein